MTWISISIYTHLHWLHIDVAQVVVQTLTSPGKTWVSALENNVTQLSQLKPRLIGGAALCSHLPRPTDRQSCEESRWRLNGFFVHPQIYPQMGKFGWFGIPSILKYLFIYLYILIIFDPHFIYNLVFFGLPWFLFLCYAAQVAVISFTATSHVESSERSLSGPSCGWAVGAWSECGENCGPQQREAAEHAERGSGMTFLAFRILIKIHLFQLRIRRLWKRHFHQQPHIPQNERCRLNFTVLSSVRFRPNSASGVDGDFLILVPGWQG